MGGQLGIAGAPQPGDEVEHTFHSPLYVYGTLDLFVNSPFPLRLSFAQSPV